MTPQAFIREILTLWEGNHLAQAPALEAIRACLDGLEKPLKSPLMEELEMQKSIHEMAASGTPWNIIGAANGVDEETAKFLASLHSRNTVLPWPIPQ